MGTIFETGGLAADPGILVNLVSSTIIAAYEEVLAATIALTFFIPLLIDTGGNTGAQAASLMVRALATEDVELSQWMRVIIKELAEGLLLGSDYGTCRDHLRLFNR
jgi:magnesium transporter